jgi:hypothetical protein
LTFSIIYAIILVLKKLDKGYQERKVQLMNTNEYYNEIRSDIAKDFGLEAGGYAPRPITIPIRIAQRIANKYPSDFSQGRFNSTLNPKAVEIAKRYRSLVMGVS